MSALWPELMPSDEERARRLHAESTVFICHDHNLLETQLEGMVPGGVTAKQVFISLDAGIFGAGDAFEVSKATAMRGEHAQFVQWAMVALDYVLRVIERSGGKYVLALTPDDIVEAKANGRHALLLGSEGTRLLADRLEILRVFYRLGLRHLQLSWAFPNSVGTNQNESNGKGLTGYGQRLVHELNRLGMIVDVSHLSYESQLEAADLSKSPILNSHSGALALNPTQRQFLPDEVIRSIADHDGVIGVHFISSLVKPGPQRATLRELMSQFSYLIGLVGARHVACGPDYLPLDPRVWQNQGIAGPYTFAEGVDDISTLFNVTRGLVAIGLTDSEINGVMGGNLLRLFRDSVSVGTHEPVAQESLYDLGALTGGSTPL